MVGKPQLAIPTEFSLTPDKWAGMPNKTSWVKKPPRNFSKHFDILAVLENAGGLPEHIYPITAFCIDKPAYFEAS